MISIHAPRVGSDPEIYPTNHRLEIFQSTLPVWGATRYAGKTGKVNDKISIHAPRVGSDKCGLEAAAQNHHFNPRSPCGERPLGLSGKGYFTIRFQSTLPVWGATVGDKLSILDADISIHAPRVGSDTVFKPSAWNCWDFNPRSPCGERRHYQRPH